MDHLENHGDDFTEEEAAVLAEPSEEVAETPAQEQEEPTGAEQQEQEESSEQVPEAEQQQEKQTMVPHAAMHEERERRKSVEAELNEARQQIARFNEVLARFEQPQEQQQQPAPDPNQDPLGAFQFETEQLRAQREQREAEQRQHAEQQAQQQAIVEFEQSYIGELTERGNQDPEFQKAIDYLFDHQVQQYTSQGHSKEVATQATMRDAFNIALQARNANQDISQMFYGHAFANGYQPKPDPDPEVDLDNKLETIKKGQEQNKSLSGKGGGAPEPMTLAKLASMSDEEMDAWSKANPGMWEKIMGAA